MEWFAGIFVFIAVIAITAVLFVIWLLVLAVRLVLNVVLGTFRTIGKFWRLMTLHSPSSLPQAPLKCPNRLCNAPNPTDAVYCRRCGHKLQADVQRVSVRRVAMW